VSDYDARVFERLVRALLRDPQALFEHGAADAVHGAAVSSANDLRQYKPRAESFRDAVCRRTRQRCLTAAKTLAHLQAERGGRDGSLCGLAADCTDLSPAEWQTLEAWAKEIVLGSFANRAS
jgi:hypothetical protein